MSIESPNLDLNFIEHRFADRELKLPKGIRKYIRRLKQEGKLEEAFRVKKESTERKRSARDKLNDKLNENLRDVVLSDNPEQRALGEFTTTWMLSKTGEIPTLEERRADLEQVYRSYPEQSDTLETKAPSIIAEVSKMVKEADNS